MKAPKCYHFPQIKRFHCNKHSDVKIIQNNNLNIKNDDEKENKIDDSSSNRSYDKRSFKLNRGDYNGCINGHQQQSWKFGDENDFVDFLETFIIDIGPSLPTYMRVFFSECKRNTLNMSVLMLCTL